MQSVNQISFLSAATCYRIYSIKRRPRLNAVVGNKITNKRRPRITAAPNQKNAAFIRIIRKKTIQRRYNSVIYTILGNLFSCITSFLSSKWQHLASLPSIASSLLRTFAVRSSVVKAENFAGTTSPPSLFLRQPDLRNMILK